jgi:hypothetical protein
MEKQKAKMSGVFLSAKWLNLVHLSFLADPKLLLKYKPPNIDFDTIDNKAVISLVVFNFEDTQIKGIPLPIYGNFSELNLRFNVKDELGLYSGIVFIKEMIPRPIMAEAANFLYNENYEVRDIKSNIVDYEGSDLIKFEYSADGGHEINVVAEKRTLTPPENSVKHTLKQRNAGFGIFNGKTIMYRVEHSIWEIYPVINYSYRIDFKKLFGAEWGFLNDSEPFDITLAKG